MLAGHGDLAFDDLEAVGFLAGMESRSRVGRISSSSAYWKGSLPPLACRGGEDFIGVGGDELEFELGDLRD